MSTFMSKTSKYICSLDDTIGRAIICKLYVSSNILVEEGYYTMT